MAHINHPISGLSSCSHNNYLKIVINRISNVNRKSSERVSDSPKGLTVSSTHILTKEC